MKSNIYKLIAVLYFSTIFINNSLSAQAGLDTLVAKLRATGFSGFISGKTYDAKFIQFNSELNCSPIRHHYLWYKNNLVIQIDGTGKLFRYEGNGNVTRLDSTCFDGYNFGAFNFVYNDTIFSLGGYGYWQFNGMLRFYDESTKGWEVIPTNKTVPIMNLMYSKSYYDVVNKQIFFIYTEPKQHYEEFDPEKRKKVFVQCFDLVKKRWWDAPAIFNSKLFRGDLPFFNPGPFHYSNGFFNREENITRLFNFNKNELFTISKEKMTQIENRLNTYDELLLFSKDSLLCFFNPVSGFIDTLVLTQKDLLKSGIKIYELESSTKKLFDNPLLSILVIIGIILTSIILWMINVNWRLKKRNKFLLSTHLHINKRSSQDVSLHNPTSFKDNLTEVERALIEILILNTHNNEMTSISQINHVLGISNKPVKIQNNIRATTIQGINKKFFVFSGINDDLINKQRTEFDKRFFEYSIQRKYLQKIS